MGMGGYVQQNPWKPTARKGPISAEFASPGPAAVALPSYFGTPPPIGKSSSSLHAQTFDSRRTNSPAYSMGNRIENKNQTVGPGPVYDVSNMTYHGGKVGVPVAKLPPKDKEEVEFEKFKTPGPSEYDVAKADRQRYSNSPAWSIKEDVSVSGDEGDSSKPLKGRVFNETTVSPGPVYNIPPLIGNKSGVFEGGKMNSPMYSLSGRPADPKNSNFPGPGAYKTIDASVYKQKSPNYSLSGRTLMPGDHTIKPGPGAHSPEKVQLDAPPRFSFGIRHSPYLGCFKDRL